MVNGFFMDVPDAWWRTYRAKRGRGRYGCKLLNVNPEAYVNWVLPKRASATTKTSSGLLPHDYAGLQLH
jgi:hypothetical protein